MALSLQIKKIQVAGEIFREEGMSRQLLKLKSLISEIEEIQKQGQKKPSVADSMVESPSAFQPIQEEESVPAFQEMAIDSIPNLVEETFAHARQNESEAPLQRVTPVTELKTSTGKVSMEVSGNVSLKIKLEESDEIVEVKRIGENLSISFSDGKSVQLPLKNVA